LSVERDPMPLPGNGTGTAIEETILPVVTNLKSISDYSLDMAREVFHRKGIMLFRGIETSVDDFYQLARTFSVHLLVDPGNERTGGSRYSEIQSVTVGSDAIGFHREYGPQILAPDLIMFYCERPPLERGQTTLADGIAVWDRLSDETKALLGKRKIKYYNRYPISECLDYLGIPYRSGWETELRDTLAMFGEFELKFLHDAIELTHTEHPVVWHDACQRPCFVSSFLPGVYNALVCTFDNGDPLPEQLISEISSAMESCAVEVDWQENDVVVIDNARWFHGRRPFHGNERKILNAVGYSRFRVLPPEQIDRIARISKAAGLKSNGA